jgi:hypothetical protein
VGRVGLAALTLVALSGSAATIASTFLARAAMVMTLSLTLAAIARGTRRSRGARGRGVVGVERLRGRYARVRAEREFLQH